MHSSKQQPLTVEPLLLSQCKIQLIWWLAAAIPSHSPFTNNSLAILPSKLLLWRFLCSFIDAGGKGSEQHAQRDSWSWTCFTWCKSLWAFFSSLIPTSVSCLSVWFPHLFTQKLRDSINFMWIVTKLLGAKSGQKNQIRRTRLPGLLVVVSFHGHPQKTHTHTHTHTYTQTQTSTLDRLNGFASLDEQNVNAIMRMD